MNMRLSDFIKLQETVALNEAKSPKWIDKLYELDQAIQKCVDILNPTGELIKGVKEAEGDDFQKYYARHLDKLRRLADSMAMIMEDDGLLQELVTAHDPEDRYGI